MLSKFGPSQGRKGRENGLIWDHKCLKNGSNPWFPKNAPSPLVVPKRMNTAHFKPLFSRSHPISSACSFLPPPARSQYSILVRVRFRAMGTDRGRTRLRVGVGVRVTMGFKDNVQNGQNFPLGAFGAHGATGGTFGN